MSRNLGPSWALRGYDLYTMLYAVWFIMLPYESKQWQFEQNGLLFLNLKIFQILYLKIVNYSHKKYQIKSITYTQVYVSVDADILLESHQRTCLKNH